MLPFLRLPLQDKSLDHRLELKHCKICSKQKTHNHILNKLPNMSEQDQACMHISAFTIDSTSLLRCGLNNPPSHTKDRLI